MIVYLILFELVILTSWFDDLIRIVTSIIIIIIVSIYFPNNAHYGMDGAKVRLAMSVIILPLALKMKHSAIIYYGTV